ncbi:hypothetical protein QQF64_009661 [Cirrhinus molitorella]|uniref:Integrase catalytic domain-containing protein n=1 Tax=Cirrhinus molitorella TaxID=172907 RepID=A0ABR3M1T1_9TELE
MQRFQLGEDIENYLRRFERLAKTWRWLVEDWSYRRVPLLTGQALEAYLAMDEERAELKNLYKRWVRPEEHSKEEISEAIILEQLPCPALTRAQARAGLQLLPDLDSLLQGRTKGPKKSWRQRQLEKYLGTPTSDASVEGLEMNGWKVPGNTAQLQREDETLKPLFVKAEYKCCVPAGQGTPASTSCYLCTIRLITMDIVGPLEKSSAGHRYILVVSDYTTRYPEAFPLRSITTPKIIHALVQLFSRVGIPEEILTDQGTNFTSRLMGQLNKQLGITAFRMIPYHPHTQVLWRNLTKLLRTCCRTPLRMVGTRTSGLAEERLGGGTYIQDGIVQYVLEMQDRLEQNKPKRTYKKNKKCRKDGASNI